MNPEALLKLMSEENEVVSRLVDVILLEREGIVAFDPALLTECHHEKKSLLLQIKTLEEKRAAATGKKSFEELIWGYDLSEQEKLRFLRLNMKAKTREARALHAANAILFKQSQSFVEHLCNELWSSGEKYYKESGEIATGPVKGAFMSSSA